MPVAVSRGFPNTNMPIDNVALAKVVPIFEKAYMNEVTYAQFNPRMNLVLTW